MNWDQEIIHEDDTMPVLFPLIDSLNHFPITKITWQPSDTSLEIISGAEVSAGAEVYNNYGPKPNEECTHPPPLYTSTTLTTITSANGLRIHSPRKPLRFRPPQILPGPHPVSTFPPWRVTHRPLPLNPPQPHPGKSVNLPTGATNPHTHPNQHPNRGLPHAYPANQTRD